MEINKALYGDGSNNAHLREETIMCEHYNGCSLYNEGKCYCVTVPFGERCKFGTINKVDGGTKRGKKYHIMTNKVKGHELYHKLDYPSSRYIYRVNDIIAIRPVYISIKENDGKTVFDNAIFTNGIYYINEADFTIDFLHKLCSSKPRSLMGGVIKDYQEKVVPHMLIQLKNIMPDIYNEFISEYPEFDKAPDYRGKYAYLSTLNKDSSIVYRDCHGNKYHFEGDFLVGTSSVLMPFDAKNVELKIPVTSEMIYKIDDNRQVVSETKFK